MSKSEERRNHIRTKISMDVRVRSSHPRAGDFKEVLSTQNFSRGGLYFITSNRHYNPRMRLRIVCPYSSDHDVITLEENAEVTRLETLPYNKLGVAILLRGSSGRVTFGGASVSNNGRNEERRRATRHWFSAAAIITESDSNTQLHARCSDLSLVGTYIDTLNPFAEGSALVVSLIRQDELFKSFASAATNHPGVGMGLEFGQLSLGQKSILSRWLAS